MEILRLLDGADWIAPHHRHLVTFPHHKHAPEGIFENLDIALPDVLEEIREQIDPG